jgi:hypothetical protein
MTEAYTAGAGGSSLDGRLGVAFFWFVSEPIEGKAAGNFKGDAPFSFDFEEEGEKIIWPWKKGQALAACYFRVALGQSHTEP